MLLLIKLQVQQKANFNQFLCSPHQARQTLEPSGLSLQWLLAVSHLHLTLSPFHQLSYCILHLQELQSNMTKKKLSSQKQTNKTLK